MKKLTNEKMEKLRELAKKSVDRPWDVHEALSHLGVNSAVEEIVSRLLAAEAQLSELEKQEPIGYIHNFEPFSSGRGSIFNAENRHYGRKVFADPSPQAASQPVAWKYEERTYVKGLPGDGYVWREKIEDVEPERDDDWVRNVITLFPQPASQPYTVPDEMAVTDEMTVTAQMFAKGHNACRAAMLGKKQ
uniref:Uncharacterized protein n=2 Tax=unclassified Caudoviricetes TaxID=2788787 RepID=A0AB39ACE2_9CAUD